jgi:HSP20 family protein
MAETAIRLPVRNESRSAVTPPTHGWYPFANLRRDIDRLFEDLDMNFWQGPFRRPMQDMLPFGRYENFGRYNFNRHDSWENVPVEVFEKEGDFEIVCELPGIDEKDIEVKYVNGMLMIRGFKKQPKEEIKRDYYYFSERRYGSFERWFAVPEWVDFEKISAVLNKGVLTIVLPKSLSAQKQEKKIAIKAA